MPENRLRFQTVSGMSNDKQSPTPAAKRPEVLCFEGRIVTYVPQGDSYLAHVLGESEPLAMDEALMAAILEDVAHQSTK